MNDAYPFVLFVGSVDKPTSRLAAVLVLLFERDDHLRVLLTTRAKQLRTHGGETSLPGGKMEDGDKDIIITALREANEEVGLPMNSSNIHILGTLPFQPFHSLIVTPVVALLTDNAILDNLKAGEGEVDHIFSHPLEAVVDPELAPGIETLVEQGGSNWPYEPAHHHHIDYPVKALGGVTYRVHCYRTAASPITGMTSDILIQVAEIAYRKQPTFERYAYDQLQTYEAIVEAYEANLLRRTVVG
ncbi:hypothetical protein HYPSUDRAFT_41552 [Hypholoma sublateritium FD-334 SS-4]|uniref:Nudix hydrolase domain-containing protein n=1 Tax=Hypholoma sublateritium (strain FD-334 SS-4) TaxID=945553 RepID=A0A0D2PPV6_HYPSF|nr:hypothetical protein HYPSUDRAFT_41552 [Hypholoma sublateritium FD-334 SS-4]